MFFIIGPALIIRLTPAGALAVAALAGMLRWAVMAHTTDPIALALMQSLHGITLALLHLANIACSPVSCPMALRVGTGDLRYGGVGAATALLTLVSGALYARLSAQGFWVMFALCVVALPLTRKLRQPLFGESTTQ